jgi:hypothetical protein
MGVSWIVCLGWPQTMILLISASQISWDDRSEPLTPVTSRFLCLLKTPVHLALKPFRMCSSNSTCWETHHLRFTMNPPPCQHRNTQPQSFPPSSGHKDILISFKVIATFF